MEKNEKLLALSYKINSVREECDLIFMKSCFDQKTEIGNVFLRILDLINELRLISYEKKETKQWRNIKVKCTDREMDYLRSDMETLQIENVIEIIEY
jgi:hypothetical protein